MSDEKPRLGQDVFVALAAVGWADGHLDQEEADAIVKAALDEGLELEDIAKIEEATKSKVELGELDTGAMSADDKGYIYAVASWMTRLDQEIAEGEKITLDALAAKLDLDEAARADIDIAVQEVAYLSEDERPLQYDLVALRKLISQRLDES